MKHDAPGLGLGRPKPRSDGGSLVLFAAIAALYFTREILIPFAFALTLAFLLSPVVAQLQRLRIGRVVSVLITVLASMMMAGGIGWIIANQLVDVANQLPLYRQNIHAKIEAFHLPVAGQLSRAAASVQEIGRELSGPEAPAAARLSKGPGLTRKLKTDKTGSPDRIWSKVTGCGGLPDRAPSPAMNQMVQRPPRSIL
jgi:hypothetical protein